MLTASNLVYDVADRTRAVAAGGIGAMVLLARHVGLADAIDRNIHVLRRHLPYHESDHVLNIAFNVLAGGTCIEDLELRRTNEAYLDALGASRIPDPTTAGDFCRRFENEAQILQFMETINQVRVKVWQARAEHDPGFFDRAILDGDGTIAPTWGECKQGMNISYDGQWGYHPLLISLANTKEPLYLVNRSGNRPSHERADEYFDHAIGLCREAGFKSILLRGDTDFTQTWKLDGWDDAGDIRVVLGTDAARGMIARAQSLDTAEWKRLERPPRYEVKTQTRARPQNVKEQVVASRGYKNFVLQWEDIAEFEHRPGKCDRAYRLIALRKKINVMEGEVKLFDEYRYFFYITNDRLSTPQQIVFTANDRCDQENLIEQMKNGVRALRNPLDNLYSNWAYMVMASLAWTLKAWAGLLLPAKPGRWRQRHEREKERLGKMEFKSFRNALIELPCQIVRTGRRIVYRLLAWNPWAAALLRLADAMRKPMRSAVPMRC